MAIVGIKSTGAQSEQLCSTGEIRYRVNCLNKLIIQTKVRKFTVGKGWKNEWVDAKCYDVRLTED